MPLPRLPVQMTNYVNSYRLSPRIDSLIAGRSLPTQALTTHVNSYRLSAIDSLIAGRSLPTQALTKLMGHGKRLIEYLKQRRESEVELLNTHGLINWQMSRSWCLSWP